MSHALPSFEAPLPEDIDELIAALMGEERIAPAMLARLLDPARLEAGAAAAVALRELDWPNLGRYEQSNTAVMAAGTRPDLVFMGDSLTELWPHADARVMGPGRLCRGISGQTTPQMLLRFQADVIALRPRAVHLLGGANDIAGNTGPSTPYRVQCNIETMAGLAQASGIQVLLGLLPPSRPMPWNRELARTAWTNELNTWLRTFGAETGCVLVDYHSALADAEGAMPADCSHDGLHPNRRGYTRMRPVLDAAIAAIRPF